MSTLRRVFADTRGSRPLRPSASGGRAAPAADQFLEER